MCAFHLTVKSYYSFNRIIEIDFVWSQRTTGVMLWSMWMPIIFSNCILKKSRKEVVYACVCAWMCVHMCACAHAPSSSQALYKQARHFLTPASILGSRGPHLASRAWVLWADPVLSPRRAATDCRGQQRGAEPSRWPMTRWVCFHDNELSPRPWCAGGYKASSN